MNDKRKCIFIDIDGTIFEYHQNLYNMCMDEPVLLEGVIAKFLEWRQNDYYIVLTTARAEGTRFATEKQLASVGVFYDKLIMGLPNGNRYLINDRKPDTGDSAFAICLDRDQGIGNIEL